MARTCSIALKVGRCRHQHQGWESKLETQIWYSFGCGGLGVQARQGLREEITSLLHIGIKWEKEISIQSQTAFSACLHFQVYHYVSGTILSLPADLRVLKMSAPLEDVCFAPSICSQGWSCCPSLPPIPPTATWEKVEKGFQIKDVF